MRAPGGAEPPTRAGAATTPGGAYTGVPPAGTLPPAGSGSAPLGNPPVTAGGPGVTPWGTYPTSVVPGGGEDDVALTGMVVPVPPRGGR